MDWSAVTAEDLVDALREVDWSTPPRPMPDWKNLFSYLGPGFFISIAYIDPGNFEMDLHAGAQYKYEVHFIYLRFSCALWIQWRFDGRAQWQTGCSWSSVPLGELCKRGRRLEVGSLEDVLKKMEINERNSGWDDLIFIPPRKSLNQHISEDHDAEV